MARNASRAYDFDALVEAEEPPAATPRRTWCLVRQESGQFVYKFFDAGRWHARRVPKSIVLKADAVEWVVEVVYGLPTQNRYLTREAKLSALIAGTDNKGERTAAEQALAKLRAKRETT